tara:strand:- start:124 stop:261 length:138 start_codon:yes stop_codon:yes gene_type:complete
MANLRNVIKKKLFLGKSSDIACNARALIDLCGLGVDGKTNPRNRK